MEEDLDLMRSGAFQAAETEDLQNVALDCLKKTIALVWCTVHYPPGNKAIADAAQAWKTSIGHMLTLRNSFLLALLKTRLYFEDTRLDTHDEMTTRFIKELGDRRIRKIIFWRGVNEQDLERFSPIMSGKARDLLEQGGPCEVLKNNEVQRIEIVENEYLKPEEQARAGKKEYWEQKLEKMGLDKGEIILFLLGKGRLPRLLTDEIRLLVEAMKDPQFLSGILLHIAMGLANSRTPNPDDLYRICGRVEYVLLLNSVFDPQETPRILARAVRSFPPNVRLSLLAEKMRVEAEGSAAVDDTIFQFSPDEYAEHVVRIFEQGQDWPESLGQHHLDARLSQDLGQALKARLMTSPAWEGDTDATDSQATDFLGRLYAPLSAGSRQRALETGSLLPVQPATARENLAAQIETLRDDVQQGYMFAIIAMISAESDEQKLIDLLKRLVRFVEVRLDLNKDIEAMSLLPFILDPDLGETKLTLFTRYFREELDERYRAKLIACVASVLLANRLDLLDTCRAVAEVFQEGAWRGVLSVFFDESQMEPTEALLSFVTLRETEALPILTQYSIAQSALTRVRATEMLCAFEAEEARELVLAKLADRDRSVRLVTLFALGNNESPKGVAALTELAQKSARGGAIMERCAAIDSLGRLRKQRCISLFESIIAKRNWVRRNKHYETKACAALALRNIGTPDALEALEAHVDTLRLTRFDIVINWVMDRVRWVIALVVKIARVIVGALPTLYRMAATTVKWTWLTVRFIVTLPFRIAKWTWQGIAALGRLVRRKSPPSAGD